MSVVRQEVLFVNSNITINIDRDVYECWLQHRQLDSSDTEQFGVLIGSRINDESTVWIDKCTTPQPKDISKRTRFTMQDPFHHRVG